MNAWPSIELIAEEAKVNRATVFRAIDTLEKAGEITVLRRPGRSSYYGLTALMGSQIATGEGVANCDGEVASTRQRGRKLRPKPSVTVNEPSRARAREATNTNPIPARTVVTMPPALDAAARARGAEFFRDLRTNPKPREAS